MSEKNKLGWYLKVVSVTAVSALMLSGCTPSEPEPSPPLVGSAELTTKAPASDQPEPSGESSAPPSPSASASRWEDEDHPPDGPQAPELGEWEPVVDAFAKEWANDTGGHAGWLKRMRPYITDELYEGFESTDPMWILNMDYDSFVESDLTRDKEVMARRVNLRYDGDKKPKTTIVVEIQDNGEWLVSAVI